MLTTEVVKGLLAGKVYRRKGDVFCGRDNFVEIKMDCHIWRRQKVEMNWCTASFTIYDLLADWEEVTEWQEIDWKEAVECEDEDIPLQFYGLTALDWIDKTKAFEDFSFSFVRKHKWRKKVEVK